MKAWKAKTLWAKYQYLVMGILVIVLTVGSIGFLFVNLRQMEQSRLHEYQSLAEKISHSAMNFIMEERFDHLLDMMRLLTSMSTIHYMALYVDGKAETQVGKDSELVQALSRCPGEQSSWQYAHNQKYYLIVDVELPYHPDLLKGVCVLRIAFSLEQFVQRKDNILLAILVILLLLAILIAAFYRLAYVEKTKSVAINCIAHDAKKPLSTSLMRLDFLLLTSSQGKKISVPRRDLELSLEDEKELLRFLDNLENHEKLRRGDLAVCWGQHDLVQILSFMRDAFRVAADKKGMKVELQTTCSFLEITTDKDLVKQVLANLLDNAVNYGQLGSRIMIHLEKQNTLAQVEICNQGKEIPENEWERIFKPFVRLETKVRGTGLGLSTSRDLIHLLGGELAIRSAKRNTIFYFTLPWGGQSTGGKPCLKH